MTNPNSETTSWDYDSGDRLYHQTLANGAVTTYVYNALNELTSLTNRDGSSNVLSSYSSMQYDGAGNLLEVTASVPAHTAYSGTRYFQYQTDDRLQQEDFGMTTNTFGLRNVLLGFAIVFFICGCSKTPPPIRDQMGAMLLVARRVESFNKAHDRLPSGYNEIKADVMSAAPPNKPLSTDRFSWRIERPPKGLESSDDTFDCFCKIYPTGRSPFEMQVSVKLNPQPKAGELGKQTPVE